MDTHTAVAMDIASRFAHPNRPMILSATAHYSKFAYDVLTGLRQYPSSHHPAELFSSLRKLDARPPLHASLEFVVSRPKLQTTVCDANICTLMKEIEIFLKR